MAIEKKRGCKLITVAAFTLGLVLLLPTSSALAWKNGQDGNADTDKVAECSSPPPYSAHDWIADHALAMLPDAEKAWLLPHKTLYLLGTEAPDNRGYSQGMQDSQYRIR